MASHLRWDGAWRRPAGDSSSDFGSSTSAAAPSATSTSSHTKRLHLVVVRRDMIDFQHLHPTQVTNGSWATPLKLHEAGSYRVFADFSTGGRPYVLADDLLADGTVAWQALTAPTFAAEIDGFRIQLDEGIARPAEESQLEFAVTRNG